MTEPPRTPTPAEALTRAPGTAVDLGRLAHALGAAEALHLLPDQASLVQEMLAAGPRTPDEVTGPTPFPQNFTLVGRRMEGGGFAPCVFTDGGLAQSFTAEQAIGGEDAAVMTLAGPPMARLEECLRKGYAGIHLDPGSGHAAFLDRDAMVQLHRLMRRASEAKDEAEDGAEAQTPPPLPRQRAAPSGEGPPPLPASPVPGPSPEAVTDDAGAAGGDADFFAAGDPVAATGGPDIPAAGDPDISAAGDPDVPAGGDPDISAAGDPDIPAAVRRLGERPTRPAVPPPGRPPTASTERARELTRLWGNDEIGVWELVDAVAFELDLWVPVEPQPWLGMRWPLVGPHPEQKGKHAVHLFTDPDAARASKDVGEDLLHLSGIEALRWMWASPTPVAEYLVQHDPGRAWLALRDAWAISAIYPHAVDYGELDRVARVAVARLGALPGARGTKAECVRALVQGWKNLVGMTGPRGGDAEPFERGDGRYLPVFSGPEAYFDFERRHPEAAGSPVPCAKEPPFRAWLHRVLACCDGVLLDPAGETPLVLDATDLVILALWTGQGNRRPDGNDFAVGVASLSDIASPRALGRLLADWPAYHVAVQTGPEGEPVILMLPNRDCCAVFSSREKAERYVARFRDWGHISGEWRVSTMLSGWVMNIFQFLEGAFAEGAWLNPRALKVAETMGSAGSAMDEVLGGTDPDREDGDGLHVTPEMIGAALERLDERLAPRVEGFRVGTS